MIKLTITHTEPQSDDEIHISDAKDIVDNSVSHLVVKDSLDYVGDRLENIKILLSKLRIDGIIELSGVDIFALARSMVMARTTLPTINDVLYGGRQSIGSLMGTAAILKEAGLDIEIKQLNDDDNFYYLKAKRCLNT